MLKNNRGALAAALLMALVGLYFVVERGGAVAWGALLVGVGCGLKSWFKPGARDLLLVGGWALVSVLTSFAAYAYVIGTWESGEVIEMTVDSPSGPHTARVWVMDIASMPTVYYEAPPQVAKALLTGAPVKFVRAGQSSMRTPRATRADELAEEDANRVLGAMDTKYGELNSAAVVYYLLLGSPRDRVSLVVNLEPTSQVRS